MDTYNISLDKDSECLIIKQGGSYVAVNEKYIELRIPKGTHMEILREEITDDLGVIFTHRTDPIAPTYRSVPCENEAKPNCRIVPSSGTSGYEMIKGDGT